MIKVINGSIAVSALAIPMTSRAFARKSIGQHKRPSLHPALTGVSLIFGCDDAKRAYVSSSTELVSSVLMSHEDITILRALFNWV
jgi:hypothetical protein